MLQIHTDPQAESPSNLSGGAAGMSPNVLGSDNMTGMNPGQNSTGTTGMNPMQSSNMALIPQRPEHMMLHQGGMEIIEGPAAGR